jgi:hypothetical protein
MLEKWVFQRLFVRMLENGKPFFNDMFHDIGDIFKELFIRFPRHLKDFIVRLWQYSPILMNDVDWDYSRILVMLQYKIKRTRLHMDSHDVLVHSKKYVRQMKQVEELIEQILDDDFTKVEDAAHDEKWGKMRMTGIDKDGNDGTYCRFLRLNVRTMADEEQERKEHRNITKLGMRRNEAAWNKLWKLINLNMRHWWD